MKRGFRKVEIQLDIGVHKVIKELTTTFKPPKTQSDVVNDLLVMVLKSMGLIRTPDELKPETEEAQHLSADEPASLPTEGVKTSLSDELKEEDVFVDPTKEDSACACMCSEPATEPGNPSQEEKGGGDSDPETHVEHY